MRRTHPTLIQGELATLIQVERTLDTRSAEYPRIHQISGHNGAQSRLRSLKFQKLVKMGFDRFYR